MGIDPGPNDLIVFRFKEFSYLMIENGKEPAPWTSFREDQFPVFTHMSDAGSVDLFASEKLLKSVAGA